LSDPSRALAHDVQEFCESGTLCELGFQCVGREMSDVLDDLDLLRVVRRLVKLDAALDIRAAVLDDAAQLN
jgi:hypothetical protein